MKHEWYKRIFGVGPLGAAISIILLLIFCGFANIFDQPLISGNSAILHGMVISLVVLGAILHCWSFWTLRTWWHKDQLCTHGPFRYFRHPMYTAWITFISLGVALYLNSWFSIFWFIILHIIWHKLIIHEEAIMIEAFGKDYLKYSAKTGRFFPRMPW
jgi:protein-S-isoprenylcysteine O-methyltransferase Ste14